jgi:2,3,4,5-tetrahydropyridine-2-carboxylate N-succinyltransferase
MMEEVMEKIETKEDFKNLIENVKKIDGYRDPIAFGICRVDRGQLNSEKILQATYPIINWNENFGSAAVFAKALIESGVEVDFSGTEFVADADKKFAKNARKLFKPYLKEATGDAHKNVQVIQALKEYLNEGLEYKVVFIYEDDAPKSVEAVYLKLYALSLQKAALRSLNLNGAFGLLSNCAWLGNTPIELDWLRANEIELKMAGEYPAVDSVDKFPRFLQHVIPADNTRILESSKVRMGAQLAAGTTVMPGASYINFNAGTEGPVMVEGRISSSAIVGSGSDVGGGASILGVLSGTDGNPVTIGENTLLGANSCTGMPIGNSCIIDAGVTVLPGTKITVTKEELAKIKEANPECKLTTGRKKEEVFKGIQLSPLDGIHYRYDSVTGKVIARRSTREVKLNADLH